MSLGPIDIHPIQIMVEATKMFQAIKASLDTVMVFVKSPVVRDNYSAVPFWRNDGLCFLVCNLFV